MATGCLKQYARVFPSARQFGRIVDTVNQNTHGMDKMPEIVSLPKDTLTD
jgi:hypothetical protein